ncbi:MAG TPA: hypothetical protein VEF72_12275 [Mycobacterium sp.]|nr:hypothetical protein [Mycobacterium sp.]
MTSVQIIANRRHDRPGVLRHLAGIAPSSALGFIAAQILGALLGRGLVTVLYPEAARVADEVIVSHHNRKTTIDQWSSS